MNKCPDCGSPSTKGFTLHRAQCPKAWKPAPVAPVEPAAVQLGRRGGQARARNLSAKQMSEIGRLGARKRWDKVKGVSHEDH